ncbi:MAG: hypothetical protein H6639_03750 [Caldilineaceae bacterium]|nr:hypothetical protein [Caldilineaceae bacterium]
MSTRASISSTWAAGWPATLRRFTRPTTSGRSTRIEFHNWDAYAVTLRFKGGAVGTSASTYALFPEIQEPPSADFALRDRLVRVTDRGAAQFTPQGVEEWPNDEPLHAGVNRAFVEALRKNDPSLVATPLRAGLESTAVVLAANASAATGQPVDVAAFLAASV